MKNIITFIADLVDSVSLVEVLAGLTVVLQVTAIVLKICGM